MKKVIVIISLAIVFLLSGCEFSNIGIDKNTHTIIFDSIDGSEVPSVNTDGNSVIIFPGNPTKEGFSFAGWYWDNETYLRQFTANSLLEEPISSDLTVYAKWFEEEVLSDNTCLEINNAIEIEENYFQIDVKNDVTDFSFIDKIVVDNKAEWKLYSNITGTSEIVTKTISLNVGDNLVYILVSAENEDIALYNINVRRLSIDETNSQLNNTPTEILVVYEGGESIDLAETKQISAVVLPSGADQTVTWAVDDEDIATISATGLLTTISEGIVNVTVTSIEKNSISATVQFTVIETDAQKLAKLNAVETGLKELWPAAITENYTLPTYEAIPEVLVKYIYGGFFHAAGTVYEYNPGPIDLRQTISVNLSYAGKSKTFDISFIITKSINLVGVNGSSYVLVSQTTTLLSSLTGPELTWSSSNETVATVSNSGVVTGVSVGEAVITITYGSITYTFDIAVIDSGNADILLAYQAKNHILANIPASTRTDFDLPEFTGAVIEYEVDSLPITTFVAQQDIDNIIVTIETTITVNTTVITFDVKVVVIAKTDDVIVSEALAALDVYLEEKGYLDSEFRVLSNMNFAGFTFEGVTITWTSDNMAAISNTGYYIRGNDDIYVPIKVRLNRNSQNKNRTFTVLVGGYSKEEKIEFITTEGVLKDLMNGNTTSDVNLPSKDLKFGATITWVSSNTAVLNNDGSLVAPVSAPVSLTLNATITYYKDAYNINNFVETVEVPFTVNPFSSNVDLAAHNYGLAATCVPTHFPYGKDAKTQITGLDTTFVNNEATFNITWAPADATIFDANFNLLKQYFMYKETTIVATLTDGTDTATTEFVINVGIAENPTDIAVSLTSDVPLSGFSYDKWIAINGFLGAADGGANLPTRGWQGFSGNIFKTTITVQAPASGGEDVNYVIYVVGANTNNVVLKTNNLRTGVWGDDEDGSKKYLNSASFISTSYGKIAQNGTETSFWVKDSAAKYFPGFNYLTAYQACILNFDSVTKLCTPVVIPMDGSGTEYEVKPGGFLIQRGYIDQGVYDLLKNASLTVEHQIYTRR